MTAGSFRIFAGPLLGAVFFVTACTPVQQAVVTQGVENVRAAKDAEAEVLKASVCAMSLGAYHRVNNATERRALDVLCGGEWTRPVTADDLRSLRAFGSCSVDRRLAARLARYSELAYEGPEAVRAALPGAAVTFFDRDHTQAYAIETAAETVVAFRGTQVFADPSLADVLSNLWFRRRPWDPGKVHRGYREALLDIAQELKRPLYSGRRPLYFTGHSMGGALATLASTMAPGPSATYSFGAPRVGDGAFAQGLRNLVRVVHGADIAPRYPFPLGYRHGGQVWHLSGEGVLTPGLPPGWHLRIPLTLGAFAQALRDHRASEYARKLAVAAE